MKKTLKSFIHKPKQVALVSIIISILIGIYGYAHINKKESYQISDNSSIDLNSKSSLGHNLSLGFLSGGRIKSVQVKAGDTVIKGQELASLESGNTLGALTQAKASYEQAKANYQKLINGSTGPTIDVAKASVHTAQVNLKEATKQQDVLIQNSYSNLLNSTPEAVPTSGITDSTSPTISGNYSLGKEGDIVINTYTTGGGSSFSVSGLTSGNGTVTTTTPQPIGDSGLYIKFPSTTNINPNGSGWTISIPNKKASNYLTNLNVYESAVQTRTQTLATLQAILDQANASLTALVAQARPEDISSAQAQVDAAYGAIQIAQSAYDNTIIKAPYDGVVKSVLISVGQIAVPNATAIEFESK